MLGSAGRIYYLLGVHKDVLSEQRRKTISWNFGKGTALFLFGFFIWNLDNIFCKQLTDLKVRVGWPLAFLLEG